MSTGEAELIQRAKKGDPAAFAEIYDQCQPAVYRYVFYQVGDAATAEDLTSEVFVRLVEKVDRFTYRGRPLLAWLYTIARNLVTDHHRRAGRSLLIPADEWPMADAGTTEAAVEDLVTQRQLAAAVAHLTEEQRQVILMRFIEGLDNAMVAQVLGKSVGAVKALQYRALAALRRVLKDNQA